MLSALGLRPAEEEIYRRLVTHVHTSAVELATLTGRTPVEVTEVLTDLAARGLVVADPSGSGPGPATIFSAAPPAVALGALLRQQRDDLHSAEQDVAALVEEHRVAAVDRNTSDVMEVITDVDAVRHRFAQIQEAATKHKIVLVCGWGPWAQHGALLAYGPDVNATVRLAAAQVDKILKGAKPGELPIEQPTRFQLVINTKTAKAFGLTVPSSLLLRAVQVIE
jgi:hypothetical protein